MGTNAWNLCRRNKQKRIALSGGGRSPRVQRKHNPESVRTYNVDFECFYIQNRLGLLGPGYLDALTSIDGHG